MNAHLGNENENKRKTRQQTHASSTDISHSLFTIADGASMLSWSIGMKPKPTLFSSWPSKLQLVHCIVGKQRASLKTAWYRH